MTTSTTPSTSTELRGLLRGCMTWRDDRPWIDDDALGIVADWCEENERDDEARAIREAMEWEDEEDFFRDDVDGETSEEVLLDDVRGEQRRFGEPQHFQFQCEAAQFHGTISAKRGVRGFALATCSRGGAPVGIYGLGRDEDARSSSGDPIAPGLIDLYPPGALNRVCDLARWDLICHMLGCPPLRLVSDD